MVMADFFFDPLHCKSKIKYFVLLCVVCRCFKRHSRASLNRQQELSHLPTPPQLRLHDYLQRRKERRPAPAIDLKISKTGNVSPATHVRTRTHAHTRTQARIHRHTCENTHTQARTRAQTRTQEFTDTNARTRTRTHTHTWI